MVKYCIIVLTAGRKTAQPVVPARRVARIRAACTLLSRPRPTACLVASYRGIAPRRVASRSVTSLRHACKQVIFLPLSLSSLSSHPVVVHHPLRPTVTTGRGSISSFLDTTTSNDPVSIPRHVPRVFLLLSPPRIPATARIAATTPIPPRMTTEPRRDPVVFRVLSRVRCLADEPPLGTGCSSSSSSGSRSSSSSSSSRHR